MNKSQKLDMMILRAKMKAEKLLKQHNEAWRGETVKEVSDGDNQ